MPLELISCIDKWKRIVSPADKGFLIAAKVRFNKNIAPEAMKWLKSYAQLYYEAKCPEDKNETAEASDGDEPKNGSAIQFIQRDLIYESCVFIASNLVDPGDYLHFILHLMAESKGDKRTKFPLRAMPVHGVCEARSRAVENIAVPLMEQILGSKGDYPYRFSLTYRGSMDGEYLTQKEAGAVVRNAIWSVNPNCVQCIKFQDYAILIDILNPLLCIGIAKDFNKLAGYNTVGIKQGLDLRDQEEDSEDDISDDPTLDEEEEKRRKLRIKRKRRAEKAGLAQHNAEAKRMLQKQEEEEERHEEEEEEEEEEEDAEQEENEREGMEEDARIDDGEEVNGDEDGGNGENSS